MDEFFAKLNDTLSPIKSAVEDTRTRLSAIEESGKKREDAKNSNSS